MHPRGIEKNLEQGTLEWLEWRSRGIGGSDADVLKGNSPFKTVHELWEEKMGIREPSFSEEAKSRMARGHEREPIARDEYIKHTGIYVRPATLEHPHYPFFKTSLDGITRDFFIINEIKAPTKPKVHEIALAGEVPVYYRAQLQWNMMVSGANEAHFFTFYPEYKGSEKTALVIEKRDEQYIAELMRLGRDFWLHVQAGVPLGKALGAGLVVQKVGLVQISGYARAGKDTVGKVITDTFGSTRFAYADGLKRVAISMGLWDGTEKNKERGRLRLIALGDGMRTIDSNIWVTGVFNERNGSSAAAVGKGLVVTDCRKVNELIAGQRAASELGVPHRIFWIERPGIGPVHESEANETRLVKGLADRVIVNDVDINEDPGALKQAVLTALSGAGPRVVRASNFRKEKP